MISIFFSSAITNNWSRDARFPASSRISQSTPAGAKPAIRARSTAASVWPARLNTPPSLASNRWTCPGRTKSSGWLRGSTIVTTVRLRSSAVIPVRLRRWSSGVIKAVPSGAVLLSTSGCTSSRSQISGKIGMQKSPRPVMIKLTFSGVAFSAAQIKSPSFSRPSSSTTLITSPREIASTAACTVENPRLIRDSLYCQNRPFEFNEKIAAKLPAADPRAVL